AGQIKFPGGSGPNEKRAEAECARGGGDSGHDAGSDPGRQHAGHYHRCERGGNGGSPAKEAASKRALANLLRTAGNTELDRSAGGVRVGGSAGTSGAAIPGDIPKGDAATAGLADAELSRGRAGGSSDPMSADGLELGWMLSGDVVPFSALHPGDAVDARSWGRGARARCRAHHASG